MKTIIFTIAIALMLFSGCTYSAYPKFNTASYPNTDPQEILIFPKSIDQEYEIIGLVGADVKGDSITAIQQIRKIAAKQGADAIIHFTLNQLNSTELTGGSGVTVKLVHSNEVSYLLR